jgi:integrase/recombinase XerD
LLNDLNDYLQFQKGKKVFNFGYKNLYQKIGSLDKNKKITPHMLRRGFASYCNEKSIPLYDISISMGHSDINTTASYINKTSGDIDLSNIFN